MSRNLIDRWQILPGPHWGTTLQAKTWLIEQRRQLGWSHKDVEKAFEGCAHHSHLYIGSGGGAQFDRATEKRVARFEKEGQQIPDWMFWIPLAIQHAQVPREERWQWERDNIPEHNDVRREREEEEENANLVDLGELEIALVERFRILDPDQQAFLYAIAQADMLSALTSALKKPTAS